MARSLNDDVPKAVVDDVVAEAVTSELAKPKDVSDSDVTQAVASTDDAVAESDTSELAKPKDVAVTVEER